MLKIQQDDKPFRLVVSIIRGTNAGRALSLMASGTQVAAETRAEGAELLNQFYDAATAVLNTIPVGICFGLVALIDTRTGAIEITQALQGRGKTTTLGSVIP